MIFNRPFPANTSFAVTVRYSFFAGLVVFLILFLFRPFNIDAAGNDFNILHALAYGAATSLMILLSSAMLPAIFKKGFQEEGWTLGKEILVMCWHISSIAFVNLFITHLLYGKPLNIGNVLSFLLITATVGIFPVAFILLIKQQLLYKRFNRDANAIEEELAATVSAPEPGQEQLVTLTGDNAGEEHRLTASAVRYITAADNYLKVIHLQNGMPETIVLRSTLKKAELMLAAHPNFLRCHRAYIVNLSCVEHLSGNAQGFKLHLTDVEELIPVSRAQNETLPAELRKHARVSH